MAGDLTREQVEAEVSELVGLIRAFSDPIGLMRDDVETLAVARSQTSAPDVNDATVCLGKRVVEAIGQHVGAGDALVDRQQELVRRLGTQRACSLLFLAFVRVGVPVAFAMCLAEDAAQRS